MTEKLYDTFPYQSMFEASVLAVEKTAQGLQVLLDRTLFFPNEGGQSCDKGQLNGQAVLAVEIVDENIYHLVAEDAVFTRGQVVQGEIDWAHRFSNMQLHSAEHLFSGQVHKRFGHQNSGFHLSDNIATMDFDGPLSAADIADLELAVNEIIYKNIPSKAFFPNEAEAASLPYRSKKEIKGRIRLVKFEGYDLCACCAPHVGKTGEIGMFSVQSFQSYKGGVRISYLAGKRAFLAHKKQMQLLNRLYTAYSANSESLESFLEKQKEALALADSKMLDLQEKLVQSAFSNLKGNLLFLDDCDSNIARKLATSHTQEKGRDLFCFIRSDKGYRYIISIFQPHAREVQAAFAKLLPAKGGGSAHLVMGTVDANMEEIQHACTILSQTTES